MKMHLAEPLVPSSPLLIHHRPVRSGERGSGLSAHSGNQCGWLSWALILLGSGSRRPSESSCLAANLAKFHKEGCRSTRSRDKEGTHSSSQRLTEAKGSRSRDGSRLDGSGGVEASHQQTIKRNTGGDGYWRDRKRNQRHKVQQKTETDAEIPNYNTSSLVFYGPFIDNISGSALCC